MIDARCINIRSVRERLRDCVTSTRLGYLYVPVGKAANTAIKRSLWQIESAHGFPVPVPDFYFGVHARAMPGGDEPGAWPWKRYGEDGHAELAADLVDPALFRFGVVRNPFSRLLSAYLDKIEPASRGSATRRASVCKRFELDAFPESFGRFVEQVCEQTDHERNVHWQSQDYWLAFDFVPYDNVYRFERIDEVYGEFGRRFAAPGLVLAAERAAHETSASSQILRYYDARLRDLVRAQYAADFERFGYAEDAAVLTPVREVLAAGRHAALLPPLFLLAQEARDRVTGGPGARALAEVAGELLLEPRTRARAGLEETGAEAPARAARPRPARKAPSIVIHVGMHKTGSTSIQQTLAAAPQLGNFAYAHIGPPCHNDFFYSAFAENPHDYHVHVKRGTPRAQVERFARDSEARFRKAVRSCTADTLLFSAESCMRLGEGELQRMRDFFAELSPDVRIVGYVRGPVSYMASIFQQRVRAAMSAPRLDAASLYPRYREKFERFDRVFGRERVALWKFDPAAFPEGDVVRDFCARLGIAVPARIRRVNEGISLGALSLLYAYRRFGPGYGVGQAARRANGELVRALRAIEGPRLRLAGSLVLPVLERSAADIRWMEERLGASLREPVPEDAGAVASEEDLLRIDAATLEQLCALTGESVLPATPEEIAALVHRVRQQAMEQWRARPGAGARVARTRGQKGSA